MAMTNPAGYLYRVGQSASRRYRRKGPLLPPELPTDDVLPDQQLPTALAALSPRQRAAVILVHAHGYAQTEAADALGISVSSLRNHLRRGVERLRERLEPTDD